MQEVEEGLLVGQPGDEASGGPQRTLKRASAKGMYALGCCGGLLGRKAASEIRVLFSAPGYHPRPTGTLMVSRTQMAPGRVQIWGELQLCAW
jgi:hypothetical protein